MIHLTCNLDYSECDCCGSFAVYNGELTIDGETCELLHDEHLSTDSAFGCYGSPIPLARALLHYINPTFSFYGGQKKLSFKEIAKLLEEANLDFTFDLDNGYLPPKLNKIAEDLNYNPNNVDIFRKYAMARKAFLLSFPEGKIPAGKVDWATHILNMIYRHNLSTQLYYSPDNVREFEREFSEHFNRAYYKPAYSFSFDLELFLDAFKESECKYAMEDYSWIIQKAQPYQGCEVEVNLKESSIEIEDGETLLKVPTALMEFKSSVVGLDSILKLVFFDS